MGIEVALREYQRRFLATVIDTQTMRVEGFTFAVRLYFNLGVSNNWKDRLMECCSSDRRAHGITC